MQPAPYSNAFGSYQTEPPPPSWDLSFKRVAQIVSSPPFGAGFISIALFFLILFASDILLRQAALATLGIIVTFGTLALLSLVVLILFVF